MESSERCGMVNHVCAAAVARCEKRRALTRVEISKSKRISIA